MIRKSCRFVLLIALLMCLASGATSAQTLTTLHNFGDGTVANDGLQPEAALIQGSDGNFYGTTSDGGSVSRGAVFRMTTSGAVTILHSFYDGSVANDGYDPAALIQGNDGNFYGTTHEGGDDGISGTVFRMTPSGAVTVLHSFGDEENPTTLVEGSDGNFYGTTTNGGNSAYHTGTAYRMTPSGVVTVLHSFGDESVENDGYYPEGALVEGRDGNFYGVTYEGGSTGPEAGTGYGTVFRMTPSGVVTILHSFQDGTVTNDGYYPSAALVQGSDGNFYGTTNDGGSAGVGTVFRMTLSGAVTVLHSFGDGSVENDGIQPSASLVEGSDGNFYGTTYGGGDDGISGTVFRMTPLGTVTILHNFDGTDGAYPEAALVEGSDGNFYGTTYGDMYGGVGEYGTVFQLSPGGLQAFDANYQYTGVDLSDQNVGNLGSGGAVTSARPVISKTPNARPKDTPSGPIPLFDYATFHDIKGAVADGTTKVLLQYTAPSSGKVTFVETDGVLDPSGNPADRLRDVYDLNPPVSVHTGTVDTDHVAFAVYTVPESLDTTAEAKSNPGMAVTHTVHFQVLFTPDGSSTVQQSALMPITLQSPPVLLVHGWLGDATTWVKNDLIMPFGNFQQALINNGFDVFRIDYHSTNNDNLTTNQEVLLGNGMSISSNGDVGGIKDVLAWYRNQKIAITKVDVVAHSYGGLVTRKFASVAGNGPTVDDFHQNRIRRIVTIGTPHLGSPLASGLDTVTNGGHNLVGTFFGIVGFPFGEAVKDFEPGSAGIASLTQNNIPSFAEVGNVTGSQDFLVNDVLPVVLDVFGYSNIFGTDANDGVVAETSQEDGLPSPYYHETRMTSHLEMTSSLTIAIHVASILTGPVSAFDATGFPPVQSPPSNFANPSEVTPFVTIASPTAGQAIQAGSSFTVAVTPNTGETIAKLVIVGGSYHDAASQQIADVSDLTMPPYTATFTVPTDYLGTFPVSVVASDTSGNVCTPQIELNVQTSATAQSIVPTSPSVQNNIAGFRQIILPQGRVRNDGGTVTAPVQLAPIMLTNQGSTYQLDIIATFSDGVQRDITAGSAGTVYTSSEPTVATVSADGLITAVADGNAVITVTNGSATAVANVAVNFGVPSILSITPAFGALGASVPVTITGYDLGGASAVQVLLNGVADSKITVTNIAVTAEGTTLTADVNIAANALPGMRTFVVTTPGGTSDASAPFDAAGFTVSPVAPTITGFTPASGPVGTNVTISGTGFATATAVTFNGTTATFTILSDTSIFTTVPSGATTGKISITNAEGTIVSAMPFTIAMPPTITSFTPTNGPVGTVVTITGTNLTGVTRVRFHNASAVTYSANAGGTQITVTVPSGAGTGTITVNTPGGQVTSSQTFTVTAAASPPTITGISPTSGTAGTVVTITGTNLTGTTSVTINGVSVAFTVVNGTTITFTIPAGITGGVISITTPGGTVTSGSITFTLLTWNSKDVAAASDGTARMLWTRSDGAAGIWIMSASDTQTAVGPAYGPFPGWSAKAVSVAGDGTSRVLWTNTNGMAGVWSLNAQGTKTTIGPTYGPYTGWTATDIATAPNGTSRVLWTNSNGQAGVWTFSASDVETVIGTTYGPYTGWTAKAVGAAGDGTARVLWAKTNGMAGIWSFNAADVETVIGKTYGPFTGWSAADLGTSSDGTSNVLWRNTNGEAGVWTFNAANAETTIGTTYGPYPGYTAAALDSANDQSRVLWVNSSRAAGLWTFNASDDESIVGLVYGPY